MRHDFLDRYSRLDSPIHRLPTMVKLLGSLVVITASVSVAFIHFWFFVMLGGILLVLSALTKIPWKFILGRLILLEPFALGIALMALLQDNGGMLFLSIMVKSSSCLLMVILLSNTTPFSALLKTLKRLHVPGLLVTILALLYRYLFVLIDEAERLNRARACRTFATSRKSRWHILASLIGQLFVRSTERAERIYAAMTARGWK